MENKKIDNIQVLLEPKIIGLLFQNVTKYVKHSSIKLPYKLKVHKLRLYTDEKGMLPRNVEGKIKSSLMGTIIDYLTRIVICHDLNAFDFLLTDLQEYPEFDDYDLKYLQFYIHKLKDVFINKKIDELSYDDVDIIVRLSKYEEFYRSGIKSVEFLPSVNFDALDHVKIMLHRSENFFNKYGYPRMLAYHSHFGGQKGITSPLSYLGKNISDLRTLIYGDGDYLLSDGIIDFKVSGYTNMRSSWKKQLLTYYLGLEESDLKQNKMLKNEIEYLAIFNPRDDMVYKIDLSDISHKQIIKFYQQFTSDIDKYTHEAQNLVRKMFVDINTRDIATAAQAKRFVNPFLKYNDGIHEIDRYEYQRYCTSIIDADSDVTCNFPGTLYLIKREGYYAVFVKSKSSLSLLNKGARKKVDHDLQYYYDNIVKYATIIRTAFRGYQEALNELSREIKAFGGKGKNHGSIVDIDFFNHIYLDPLTHEIKIYNAPDTFSRTVYPSVKKLLMTSSTDGFVYDDEKQRFIHHDEMLINYKKSQAKGELKLLDVTPRLNLPSGSERMLAIIENNTDNEELSYYEEGYDDVMYIRSRIMLKLQSLLKYNIVFYWNDDILRSPAFNNLQSQNDTTGISFKQMVAPIEDNGEVGK